VKQTIGDKISYTEDMYSALEDADALIIATEWTVFRSPDFDKMKGLMKKHSIFDGRNLYDLESMSNKGFHYESVGREKVS